MSLKKIEIRYYPPGLNIEYQENGKKNVTELNTYSLHNNLKE
jgi:hypothetical protein